jgi:hypothetical protein
MKQLERRIQINYRWWRDDGMEIREEHLQALEEKADDVINLMRSQGFTSGELSDDITLDEEDGEGIIYSGWWDFSYVGVDEAKTNERLLKASQYLVDGDYGISDQINLIEKAHSKNPNKRLYLSHIDGITEWEVTEGRLTAKEFLDIINS